MARCHRIGQTKPVTVYRLVSQDSVEEQALTRLAKKLYLSVKVTSAASGTSTDDKAPTFTKNELVKLLRGGTTALAAPIGDDWAQKPIEEILKESRERQRKREDMLAMTDEEVETMEKEYLKDQERIRTNIFEGKVLSRTNREITDGPPSHKLVINGRMERSGQTRTRRKNSYDRRILHQQRKSPVQRLGSIPHFLRQLRQTRETQTSRNQPSRLVSTLS